MKAHPFKKKFIFYSTASGILAVLLLALYFFVGNVLRGNFQKLEEKQKIYSTEEEKLNALILSYKNLKNVNVSELDNFLLQSQNISDFIDSIEEESQARSLNIKRMNLSSPQNGAVTLTLETSGSYIQLVQLLEELERKKLPMIFKKVTFEKGEEDNINLFLTAHLPYYAEETN